MKCLQVTAISTLLLLGLSACHTISGAGEDIEAAGDTIEDTTERNTSY